LIINAVIERKRRDAVRCEEIRFAMSHIGDRHLREGVR
jgi:hypothetical protein